MTLTARNIARMIDCSIVRAEVDTAELEEFAQNVRKQQFIGAHVLPCYVAELKLLLKGESGILIGTGIGFPSGAHKTATKVFEARQALDDGCEELDMVINVGALRSKRCQYVQDDIRAVVESAQGKTVKVILEVHYLSDDEIKRGCELSIRAGAHFVKTGTGWAPTGATLEKVALMKSIVGDAIKIKAAGGVRNLPTLLAMYKTGADRFGVSAKSAEKIMEDCLSNPDGLAGL